MSTNNLMATERRRPGTVGILATVISVAMLITACGSDGDASTEEPSTPNQTSGATSETTATATELQEVTIAILTFPSRATVLSGIAHGADIGAKHGLEIDLVEYAAGDAYYAGIASGEVDVLMGGVGVFQSMFNQDVPLQVFATAGRFNAQVFTADSDISSLTDLEGKSLAATTAFSEFQNMAIVAESMGLNLLEDVDLVDSQLPDVVAQLKAGRVDAGLSWEPNDQVLLQEVPDLRVVYDAAEGWRELTGLDGWELVFLARTDWIENAGESGVQALVDTMAETVEFFGQHPQEAAEIFEEITDYPPELFQAILDSEEGPTGGFRYLIEPIGMEPHPEELRVQFEATLEAGYADALPAGEPLYQP